MCASARRFAEFWVDVSLGWILFCKDKFEKLLDSGFEHTELWERKSLDPIPIMFIPSSSEKIIKQANPHVLTTFLKPLMTDLERVFIDGFSVQYAYPIESISECMFDDLPSGLATLRAIVMVWTGIILPNVKWRSENWGGILGVNITMLHQDDILDPTIRVWWNTMIIGNIGGIHLPCDV